MEAILNLGILPFVGLCAGSGAVAFLIVRAITPAKPCDAKLNADSEYALWSSRAGHYTHFKPGQRRLVHVSRGAIGANMKDRQNYWPTGVVIDEKGNKHEFHEVFVHSSGTLVFDVDGTTANVYFVTYGQISGRHREGVPTKFLEAEFGPPKMADTQEQALRKEIADLQQKLKEANDIILERDTQLELVRVSRDQTAKSKEADHQQTRSIIASLRSDLEIVHTQLKEEMAPETILPVRDHILVSQQCRIEKKTREVKRGSGCGTYYETEYYDQEVPLAYGEEGFVDVKEQVRFARVRRRHVDVKVVPLPLKENDFGWRDPKKPVPC